MRHISKFPHKTVLVGLILITSYMAWKVVYPTDTVRYKVTVEVETPEGLKTGSAVRQLTVTQQPRFSPEAGSHINFSGEAVVVDLGDRGILFASMGTNDYWQFFGKFAPRGEVGNALTHSGMNYYKSLQSKKSTLSSHEIPPIIMFRDLKDRNSLDVVFAVESWLSPSAGRIIESSADNFENLFGDGVRLRKVSIEPTLEHRTKLIDRYLPWLSGYPEPPIVQPHKADEYSVKSKLSEGNLKRGR